MRHSFWAGRLRPVLVLAAMGAALSGCVCCGPRFYGDDGRRPGYGRTSATESELVRSQAPRGGWTPPSRADGGTQERLQQRWQELARQPR